MNPQVKAKWLGALRSGKYRQGVGTLATNYRYCCLGVLATIASEEGICNRVAMEIPNGDRVSEYDIRLSFDDKTEYLPESVVNWAEIPADHIQTTVKGLDIIVGMNVDGGYIRLSGLNDEGKTFFEIADIIEQKL